MALAIFAVAVLLYILLAYFAAKTWQVWHVVLLVFLFIFSVVFMFLGAATLKVQDRWRSQYEIARRDMVSARAQNVTLTRGAAGVLGEMQLRGEVSRVLVDRGRVWRNLRLADLGEGQVVLDASRWSQAGCVTPASDEDVGDEELDEDPDAEAPAAEPQSLGLDVNAVVYAFKEAPIGAFPAAVQQAITAMQSTTDEEDEFGGDVEADEEGASDQLRLCKVPSFYVGEFRVDGDPNANNQVTLVPTMPLSESQIEQLQDPNTTWVLYEVMPVDAHIAFTGMTPEQLSALLPAGTMDPESYRALIETYARDLQAGTDMDPPERKWMTVEFTQAETIEVDVEVGDAEGQQPLSDSLFDPSGRSLVATLSQGETTQFEEGDQATFDFATAQELVSQGKAKEVQPIFHRRLRDYARTFRGLTADLDELDLQVDLADRDLTKLNDSIEQLQSQLAFQEQQRSKLESDLNGLASERQVLDQYVGRVEERFQQLRADLSRLYRSNRQMVNGMTSVR